MFEKILRELYADEYFYYYKGKNGELINPKTFIVESGFDLFKQHYQIKNAITYWVKLHPCLNFHIKSNNSNLYFTQADENLASSLHNVFFLQFKNSNGLIPNLEDKHWHLLLQNEIQNYFDTENDLLWRLLILKLSEFKYAFILNIHHAVSDGSNSFALMHELLSLIEQQVLNGEIQEPDQERFKFSKYEIEYPNDPRKGGEIFDFKWTPTEPAKAVVIPDFIKLPKDELKDEAIEDGVYEALDGSVFAYSNELAKKNKESNTGHLTMRIDEHVFKRFVENCKKNDVKLNGAIELIACLALQKLYQYFSNNNHGKETVMYAVTLNMRPQLPIILPNYVMNAWVNMYMEKFEEVLNEEDEDFWNKFWLNSKQRSDKLHQYIDSLKNDRLYEPEKTWSLLEMEKLGYRVEDVFSHMTITNLGAQKAFSNNSKGELKIKEYYTAISFDIKSYFNAILVATCSIDSKSFWTLTYNRALFKNSAAQKYLEIFNGLIYKVSSSN